MNAVNAIKDINIQVRKENKGKFIICSGISAIEHIVLDSSQITVFK